MSARALALLLLSVTATHAVLVGLDIDSHAYRLSVVDGAKKTEPAERVRDRVEESTCISFAEEGRRFDLSPSRVLPSNSTVCGYFPLFLADELVESSAIVPEKWEKDESGTMKVQIGQEKFSSEELVAMLLEHIREKVEAKLKGSDIEYFAAVPRHWTSVQRSSFMRVAKVAGMKLLGVAHKSTAIALNSILSRPESDPPQVTIVFHLSRDALEVSFVSYSTRRLSKARLVSVGQVLSSSSSTELGTKTINALIVNHLVKQFETTHRIAIKNDQSALQKLAQKSDDVRKALLLKEQTVVTEELRGKLLKLTVRSSEVKDLIKTLKPSVTSFLEDALGRSGLFKSNITNLLIAGEDSRNSALQDILQDFFASRLSMNLNEETSVAKGAAFFGANFSGQFQMKTVWMSDVGKEVATQCEGSVAEVLFPAKTAVNAKKEFVVLSAKSPKCRVFTTCKGHETPLFAFESTGAEDFAKTHGKTPKQVYSFLYDSSGVLTLTHAQISVEGSPATSQALPFTVSDSKTLSEEQLKRLGEKLKQQKTEDDEKRVSLEAKIKLHSTLRAFRALLHDKTYLKVTTEEERSGLVSLIANTEEWLSSAEGKSACHTVLTEKLTSVQTAFTPSHDRLQEAKTRPDVLKIAFTQLSALNGTMVSLNVAKDWIPLQEREAVMKGLEEAKAWLESVDKEQREKNPWETLAVKVTDIQKKMQEVARTVEKIQKAVKPKPPAKEQPTTAQKETKNIPQPRVKPLKEEGVGHRHTDL